MPEANPIQILAELLQAGQAKPLVRPDRFAPSAFYDLHYRMLVLAYAFEIHANPFASQQRRISSARLRLLQFAACRPWLLPTLRQWSDARDDAQLSVFSSQRLRRGFLGDTVHDDVVAFLVARRVFSRMGAHLITDTNAILLTQLNQAGIANRLLSAERLVLEELANVKITNYMLEGW